MTYLVSSFQLNRPEAVQKFMAFQQHSLAAVAFTNVPRPVEDITVIGVYRNNNDQFSGISQILQISKVGTKYEMVVSVLDHTTGWFNLDTESNDALLVARLLDLPKTEKVTEKRLKMLYNGELNIPHDSVITAFILHYGRDNHLNQYNCRISYTKQLPPQLVTEVKDCNTMTAANYTTYVNSLLSNRDYSFSVENRIVTLNRRVTETEECVMDFVVTGYTEDDALDTLEHVKTFVRSKLTSITMSVYLPDNVISSNSSGGMSDLEWFIKDYATKHEGVGKSRITYSISQSSYVEVLYSMC